ncbi:MAG: hypothetical protein KDB48_01355 [Solirubrobacterales bacterium]|nr:hypothetical protein [Solirubrobacterales bacterium]HMT05828.1 hypothetical protein [Solirubrobacterales bacterium]
MGTENISGKAAKAYSSARENQHVRRLIEDEELRASLIAAAMAGRKAFHRIQSNRSSAVESVTQDKRVKRELQSAAASLREAAERIKEPPKKKRHTFRNLFAVGLLTGGLVLVFSESARKSLLDAIFGAEEEFVYTSTTSPEAAQTNGTPVAE